MLKRQGTDNDRWSVVSFASGKSDMPQRVEEKKYMPD
jgi:hypothetical protein